MTMRATVFAATIALCTVPPAAAQQTTLTTVLQRAGAYVAEFHRQLSSIVAEERYVQDWRQSRHAGSTSLGHRELLSDLLLVKPDGFATWMEFRDVFEVDGTPIRERNERLVKMFLEPSPTTADQIRRILAESARFNIGDITRNVNTPIFPLLFLENANHFRFKFKVSGDRRPTTTAAEASPSHGAFRVSTEVWVIAYEEKESHTMIRTDNERDLPSRGRFWIDPATGRVLMSELTADNRNIHAIIDVSYQSEPLLGLLVPIEMRERYESHRSGTRIEGRATYGRFRQFQVKVDEKLAPIVKPR
jgi:hypothetical protein